MSVQKVIRDGKVAVLYSPGYGAGWSTWNSEYKDLLLFHPSLIDIVEKGDGGSLTEDVLIKLLDLPKDACIYCGSNVESLKIEWIPQGTLFKITEYDGCESVEIGTSEFTMA